MKDNRIEIIQAGIAEAERFIIRAKAAVKRLEAESSAKYNIAATKQTGAVKRAALDLKVAMTNINQMTTFGI